MSSDSDPNSEEQAREFLDEFAASAQPMESELLEELHRFYSTGEAGQVYERSIQLQELYSGRKTFANLSRWIEQLKEPLLRRRLASVRQRFSDFQGDQELRRRLLGKMEEYLNVEGRSRASQEEPPIAAPESGEPRRRRPLPYRQPMDCGARIWEASHSPDRSEREASFRRRNGEASAHAALLSEIFALRFQLDLDRGAEKAPEFDPEQHIHQIEASVSIPELLSELEVETDAVYADLVERRQQELGIDRMEWWDLLYEPPEVANELNEIIPEARAVALAQETLRRVDLDPEKLGISLTLYEKPRPGRNAYRFPIRIPGDVRVLIRSGAGLRAVELALHELGHAIYTSLIEQEVWEFRSPAGLCLTEAVGQLLARLCHLPEWSKEIAGLDDAPAERARRLGAQRRLIQLRIALLLARFEAEAQGTTVEALDERWAELAREVLKVSTPPGLRPWAEVRHYALYPGHMQNLLLAELIQAQLFGHYRRSIGSLHANEALGRRLTRDIFRHGARYPWPQLVQKITGRELSTEALARQVQDDLNE